MQIEKTAIAKELMRIDTRRQVIDIQQIDNRRFMYNPKTGILVLGYQYAATSTMVSNHANELADAGITKGYDDFVRGWIGTGGGAFPEATDYRARQRTVFLEHFQCVKSPVKHPLSAGS